MAGEGHDHRVDIWSLGVLICEIISGETPFRASTPKHVFERILTGQARYNFKVRETVRSLFESIFVVDLSSRPSLEDIKRHAFFKQINFDKL